MGKVFGVVTAAVAGFVAGVLLAPKSGANTRAELKRKADLARGFADAKAADLQGVADEANVAVKQTVGRAGKEAEQLSKSAKKSATVVADEAKKLRGEAKTRATRVASDAKRTAKTVQKNAEKRLR